MGRYPLGRGSVGEWEVGCLNGKLLSGQRNLGAKRFCEDWVIFRGLCAGLRLGGMCKCQEGGCVPALLLFDFVRLLCQSLSANELALLIEPPFFFVDAEG